MDTIDFLQNRSEVRGEPLLGDNADGLFTIELVIALNLAEFFGLAFPQPLPELKKGSKSVPVLFIGDVGREGCRLQFLLF